MDVEYRERWGPDSSRLTGGIAEIRNLAIICDGGMAVGIRPIYRYAVVVASATAFGLCLTRVAYVTPGLYLSNEITSNSALEQLMYGWIGLIGAALTAPAQCAFLLVSSIFTVAFVAARWRVAAAIAALACLLMIGTMLATRALGMIAWLANPLIGVAWILIIAGHRRASLIFGLVALGLMLSVLRIATLPLGLKGADLPILTWATGYWLWVASAAILVAGIVADLTLRQIFPKNVAVI